MVQDRAIGPSYNGGLIESHAYSIELRHFQWPEGPQPRFQGQDIL